MTPTIEFPGVLPAEAEPATASQEIVLPWRTRWLGWLLAPLLLLVPMLFVPRAMFFGNRDALFYGNVLDLTANALHSGTLYTRWFADANAFMGSTVMMFYGPLAYILTALIEMPLDGLHLSLDTRFLIGIYASQVLCGLTAFLWLKRRFSLRTAFIGSLLYILLPYKFIYIYAHINLAQLWALAFLPLWMLGAEKITEGSRVRGVAIFALAGAATFYCHPLTVIAFGAVPVCYVLWFSRRRPAVMAWLIPACALLAGLCLMLAWPQHKDLSWIHSDGFLSGKYVWRGNLYHIDLLLCTYYGFIAALVAWAAKRCNALAESALAGPSLFFATVIAAAGFMNLHASEFIWERISILQYLQFPAARLHAVALVAVVFLICVWLDHHKEMVSVSPRVYRPMTLAVMIALFTVVTGARIFEFYAGKQFVFFPHIDEVRNAHIIAPPEYKTRWGCVDGGHAFDLYRQHAIPPQLAAAGATVALERWNPPQSVAFTADVKAAQAGITVRQCYVPDWQAFDSGKPVPLSAAGPDGLIRINLPQGPHRIEIRLAETPDVALARNISFSSLGFSLLLLMFGAAPVPTPENEEDPAGSAVPGSNKTGMAAAR